MLAFTEKFQIEKFQIVRVGNWIISWRPVQVTLGSLILSLDRKCVSFGGITEQEGKSLSLAFKKIEEIYRTSFRPDKINYLALMMVDEQVHYHVIPRYNKEIYFQKKSYKDDAWPNPPDILNTKVELCVEEIDECIKMLKSKL